MEYTYKGYILKASAKDQVHIFHAGEQVDWVRLPNRGIFRTMREAMRLVREVHCACNVCHSAPVAYEGETMCDGCIQSAWDAKCAADGCVA